MLSRYTPNTYTSDDSDNIKYDLEFDEDPERIVRNWLHAGDSYLPWLPQNRERRIAGSKRVERYQLEHGHRKGSGKGQLLQSITAHPALSTRSFEELRVECYAQTYITQGKPPAPVDSVVTPGAVIPPLFNVYSDETDDILPNETTMTV